MKKILSFFLAAFFCLAFFSCNSENKDVKAGPGAAALVYYNKLISGDVQSYVSSMLSMDSVPTYYKDKMLVLTKQYVDKEQKEMGGLKTVELLSEQVAKNEKFAVVLLNITFGNGTKECISIDMVKHNDVWRLQ